jgi:CMP-N-acetylneuraminic acid synthetase
MSTLCIIPARGGSKGVPRKNLQLVGGVPLLARAIRTAQAAALVDRVAVSTEDAEIAAVARGAGVEVIDRPVELASDEARTDAVLLHALDVQEVEPEILVCMQCTSPFTIPQDVDGCVRVLMCRRDLDCVLTATPVHLFLWHCDGQPYATPVNHDASQRQPRQDLLPQYLETGAVYALRVTGFLAGGMMRHGRIGLYIQPPERVLDIDEPLDLERANAWAQLAEKPGP